MEELLSKLSPQDVVSTLVEVLDDEEGRGTYKFRIIHPQCPKYFSSVNAFDMLMAWWRSKGTAFVFPKDTLVVLGNAVKTKQDGEDDEGNDEDDEGDFNVLDGDDEMDILSAGAVASHDFYSKITICVPDAVAAHVQKFTAPLSQDAIRKMLVDETSKNPRFFDVIDTMMKAKDPFSVIVEEEKRRGRKKVEEEEFKLQEAKRLEIQRSIPEGPARTAYNAAVTGTDTDETNKYFRDQLGDFELIQNSGSVADIVSKRLSGGGGDDDIDMEHVECLQFLANNTDVPVYNNLANFSAAVVGAFDYDAEEPSAMLLQPSRHQLQVQGSSSLAGNTFFPYSETVAFYVGRSENFAKLLQSLAKQVFNIDFMQRLLAEKRLLPITPDTAQTVLALPIDEVASLKAELMVAVRQLALILLMEDDGTVTAEVEEAAKQTLAGSGGLGVYLENPVEPLVLFTINTLTQASLPATSRVRDMPTRAKHIFKLSMMNSYEVQQKWCEVAACEMLVQALGVQQGDQVTVAALAARPKYERVLVGAAVLEIHHLLKQIGALSAYTPESLQGVTSLAQWFANKATMGLTGWLSSGPSSQAATFLTNIRKPVSALPGAPAAMVHLLKAAKPGVDTMRGMEVFFKALSTRVQHLVERVQLPVGPDLGKSLSTVASWSVMNPNIKDALSALTTQQLLAVFQQLQEEMPKLSKTFGFFSTIPTLTSSGSGETEHLDVDADYLALGLIQGSVVDSMLLVGTATPDASKSHESLMMSRGFATADIDVGGTVEDITLVVRGVAVSLMNPTEATRIELDLMRFTSMFQNPFARVFFSLLRGFSTYKHWMASSYMRGVALGFSTPDFVRDAHLKLEPMLARIGAAIVSTDKALVGEDGGYGGEQSDADVALERFSRTFPSVLGELDLLSPNIHGKAAHAQPLRIGEAEKRNQSLMKEYIRQGEAVWKVLRLFESLPQTELEGAKQLWVFLSQAMTSDNPAERFDGVVVTDMLGEALADVVGAHKPTSWKGTGPFSEAKAAQRYSERVGFMLRVGRSCTVVSNPVAKWQLCDPKTTIPPVEDALRADVAAKTGGMLKRVADASVRRAFGALFDNHPAFTAFITQGNLSDDLDTKLNINRGVNQLEREMMRAMPGFNVNSNEFVNELYAHLTDDQKKSFDDAAEDAIDKVRSIFVNNKHVMLFLNTGIVISAPLFIAELAKGVFPESLPLAQGVAAQASIAETNDLWMEGNHLETHIAVGGIDVTWSFSFAKVVENTFKAEPLDALVLYVQSKTTQENVLGSMSAQQNSDLVVVAMLSILQTAGETAYFDKLLAMAAPSRPTIDRTKLVLKHSDSVDLPSAVAYVKKVVDKQLKVAVGRFKPGKAAEAAACVEASPVAVVAARAECAADEDCDGLPKSMTEGRACADGAKEWFDDRGRFWRLFGT